jgi:DNA-binding winged helix-turn-helix (wHTH) protein
MISKKIPVKGNNPYLIIDSPLKKKSKFILIKEKSILGRLKTINDISLEPDPQKLITRYMHCSIEFENNSYWVIDNASKNGTFIRKDNIVKKINGKEKLYNNNLIQILGSIDKNSNPHYWEIRFIDPLATVEALKIFDYHYIEYDWIQAKLFICTNEDKQEIKGLTPQEHKLIRFMQQKNKNNGNTSVMCSYEEIIEAVWEQYKITRTKNDVNHLIAVLRKKIEKNPDNPKYLLNIRGMGYRLMSNKVIV